ncbi:MAG: response regulator [Candidatus Portnoybacteria bacterium]|nr:response regulator [Candidatus Portnoybacteria bacterium]
MFLVKKMSKKILFVEDEPSLQKAMKEVLVQEGFDILTADNGEEGIVQAKENKPDLILLDLILPKKDGFTVLEELKKGEDTKDIPVIVLTNLEGTGDVEKALSLGATTYLVKANYELDDILKTVKEQIK